MKYIFALLCIGTTLCASQESDHIIAVSTRMIQAAPIMVRAEWCVERNRDNIARPLFELGGENLSYHAYGIREVDVPFTRSCGKYLSNMGRNDKEFDAERIKSIQWLGRKRTTAYVQKILKRAEDSGQACALYRVGALALDGYNGCGPIAGWDFIRKAAKQGHNGALYLLGAKAYTEQKYAAAFARFQEAATMSNIAAWYALGDMCSRRLGTAQGCAAAREYFQKALLDDCSDGHSYTFAKNRLAQQNITNSFSTALSPKKKKRIKHDATQAN